MKVLGIISFLVFSGFLNGATLINGAGATFPYPLYSKWFSTFHQSHPETQINYQSIGSGGGIRQFTDKTIDFGASDAPMTDEQLSKVGEPTLHIPTCLGAVVVSYNLPGVGQGLKLTPDVIADIYLGKIKKWDDSRIKTLNPTEKLSGDILVAYRSDGSGTTAVFTDYLSKVSPDWKQKVGQGTSVNWPQGLGGKGNEGVTGVVKQTPGAIGYVEFIYAVQNKLNYALIQNKAGQFTEPSTKTVSKAAEAFQKEIPADFRISITNASGKDAYPISSFTYLLVRKIQTDATKGTEFVRFLNWAMTEGQTQTEALHYAALPKALVKKVQAAIQTIEIKKVN